MTTAMEIKFHLLSAAIAAYNGNNMTDLERWLTVSFFASYMGLLPNDALSAVQYANGLNREDTITYIGNLSQSK